MKKILTLPIFCVSVSKCKLDQRYMHVTCMHVLHHRKYFKKFQNYMLYYPKEKSRVFLMCSYMYLFKERYSLNVCFLIILTERYLSRNKTNLRGSKSLSKEQYNVWGKNAWKELRQIWKMHGAKTKVSLCYIWRKTCRSMCSEIFY